HRPSASTSLSRSDAGTRDTRRAAAVRTTSEGSDTKSDRAVSGAHRADSSARLASALARTYGNGFFSASHSGAAPAAPRNPSRPIVAAALPATEGSESDRRADIVASSLAGA